jgi:hypothetical protein
MPLAINSTLVYFGGTMTPARRERIRVYQKKLELQRMIGEVITAVEAEEMLRMYVEQRLNKVWEKSFVWIQPDK